jgi:hypothetical protein
MTMQFNNQICLCLNKKVTKKIQSIFTIYIIILLLEQTVQKEKNVYAIFNICSINIYSITSRRGISDNHIHFPSFFNVISNEPNHLRRSWWQSREQWPTAHLPICYQRKWFDCTIIREDSYQNYDIKNVMM